MKHVMPGGPLSVYTASKVTRQHFLAFPDVFEEGRGGGTVADLKRL